MCYTQSCVAVLSYPRQKAWPRFKCLVNANVTVLTLKKWLLSREISFMWPAKLERRIVYCILAPNINNTPCSVMSCRVVLTLPACVRAAKCCAITKDSMKYLYFTSRQSIFYCHGRFISSSMRYKIFMMKRYRFPPTLQTHHPC